MILTVIEPFLSCEPGALFCSGIPAAANSICCCSAAAAIAATAAFRRMSSSGRTCDNKSPMLWGLHSGGGLSKLTVSSASKNAYFYRCINQR